VGNSPALRDTKPRRKPNFSEISVPHLLVYRIRWSSTTIFRSCPCFWTPLWSGCRVLPESAV